MHECYRNMMGGQCFKKKIRQGFRISAHNRNRHIALSKATSSGWRASTRRGLSRSGRVRKVMEVLLCTQSSTPRGGMRSKTTPARFRAGVSQASRRARGASGKGTMLIIRSESGIPLRGETISKPIRALLFFFAKTKTCFRPCFMLQQVNGNSAVNGNSVRGHNGHLRIYMFLFSRKEGWLRK